MHLCIPPTDIMNYDNAVHVVGHNNERIQGNVRAYNPRAFPFLPHNAPKIIQTHFIAAHIPK